MKIAGIMLLFSGWAIVLAAVALLGKAAGARAVFIAAGMLTEGIGLTFFVRSHVPARGEREQ